MFAFKAATENETVRAGTALGKILGPSDVICLTGDLGSGKTAFTRGIARALNIKDHITSPTFTIVNEYEGSMPLYHFDVYRTSGSDDMFEIGFEEYIYGDGITVIEWADMISDILPEEYIMVNIAPTLIEQTYGRTISFDFKGNRYSGYETRLRNIL
jgi:tRNA threonylcarbamoyladenosine biosynthesis protein TsaE